MQRDARTTSLCGHAHSFPPAPEQHIHPVCPPTRRLSSCQQAREQADVVTISQLLPMVVQSRWCEAECKSRAGPPGQLSSALPPPPSRTHLLSLPSYEHSPCTGGASLYLGRTLRRNNRKVGNVRVGAPPGRCRHSSPCRPSPARHCASSRVSGGQLSRTLHEQLTPSRNSKWQSPCQEAAAVFQQTGSPQLCSPPIQAPQTAHPAGCRL